MSKYCLGSSGSEVFSVQRAIVDVNSREFEACGAIGLDVLKGSSSNPAGLMRRVFQPDFG